MRAHAKDRLWLGALFARLADGGVAVTLSPATARRLGRSDLARPARPEATAAATFAPEDCRVCGAPTNNAEGRPCAGH